MRRLTHGVLAGLAALLVAAAGGPATPSSAVVRVETPTGHGTGFSVTAGEVLTAAHVVDGASGVRLQAASGAKTKATVKAVGSALDVAVLIPRPQALEGLRLREAPLTPGEEVLAVGFSGRRGEVSATPVTVVAVRNRVVELGTALPPGSSGGPLLTDGEVAGLVTAARRAPGEASYALTAATLRAFLTGGTGGDADAASSPAGAVMPLWGLLALPGAAAVLLAYRQRRRRPRLVLGPPRSVEQRKA